ncbi:sporulation protein YabP [Pelagirhabdus alkalitolerans]|uniref:Sporulation protein YabP n=1 Tax=Pelagirhabdus alkalitolerans TaxID=1612202 RepID=A0A1G6MIC1_9BACI|nr:sporulation protein YabP [Pelagirhabdus alkalitolerans]SDC55282.1 sporulation protein YabP [Pelagirhabdus alkalitolerans]
MIQETSHFTSPNAKAEHDIQIKNRQYITITGVKDVDRFDNETFLLETVSGYLMVRGENLQIKTLDVNKGRLEIKGKMIDLSYLDDQNKSAKGFLGKLFK